MANEVLVKQGTAVTWKASGGDKGMTFAALANGAGRCGVKADLGATFAARYAVMAQFNLDAVPTAGKTIEVYWAPSHDNTTFPAGATGTDAAYKAGEEDEWKKQLLFVGALVVTADSDTVVQTQLMIFSPPSRYGCPVVINKTGQAFEGDDNDHQLTLVPLIDEIQ